MTSKPADFHLYWSLGACEGVKSIPFFLCGQTQCENGHMADRISTATSCACSAHVRVSYSSAFEVKGHIPKSKVTQARYNKLASLDKQPSQRRVNSSCYWLCVFHQEGVWSFWEMTVLQLSSKGWRIPGWQFQLEIYQNKSVRVLYFQHIGSWQVCKSSSKIKAAVM